MRFLLLAAVPMLVIAGVASAAERYQIRDTADLVAVCDVDPKAIGAETSISFCHGFLVGAFHYYHAATPEGSRFVCAPDPAPSRTAVMNDFVAWAKAHPQYMQERGVETLFRYLSQAFPCAE